MLKFPESQYVSFMQEYQALGHVIGDRSSPSRVALFYTPPLRFEAIEHVYQIASDF